MKKSLLLSIGLVLSLLLSAQKQYNDPNAQVRKVGSFNAIKVSTGIRLMLNQGNTEAVAVSAADPETRDRLKTEVSNGVLKIYYDSDFLRDLRNKNKKLTAYVSVDDLTGLDASSGAIVKVDGEIRSGKLEMDVSSGAIVEGRFDVADMKVEQSSGSIAKISGKAARLEVEGSSGSQFNGYDLITDNCEAETSSGSNVQVTVNKELSVRASSGGNVSYKGNGVIRNVKTGSGGNVSKRS